MRLYKKAAACLLAAAMAVSMMTACGGGGGGASPVQGVVYQNSEGLVAGIDGGIPAGTALSFSNSKIMPLYTAESYYQKVMTSVYSNGSLVGTPETETMAASKKSGTTLMYDKSDDEESLTELTDTEIFRYTLLDVDNEKVAVRQKVGTIKPGDGDSGTDVPSGTLTSADVKINGTTYYAEILRSDNRTIAYCFKPGAPVPTYMFEEFSNSSSNSNYVTVFKEICNGSDNGVCAGLLKGREIYTFSLDLQTSTATVTDSKGNRYTATPTASGEWVVKDSSGNERHEFDKLIKAYIDAIS